MKSLSYSLYLIIFLVTFLVGSVQAQDDRYRVEIIVLKHLNHKEAPEERAWLKDYSEALDFLTPEPAPQEGEEGEDSAEEATETDVVELTDSELPAEEPAPDPNAVIHIEEMSPAMQDAWRRLRLSGPFRPLQFLAWEQGRDDPFPRLRVHDLDAVFVDDPYADMRAMIAAGEIIDSSGLQQQQDGQAVTGTSPPPQSFQYQTLDPDSINALRYDEETDEVLLPDPTYFYALDGTASLVRSRFLHLYLDLELREALYEAAVAEEPNSDVVTSSLVQVRADSTTQEPQPSSYMVHGLVQNRQVKTGRMEYFDGPVIAVLAYITAVPLPADDGEAATP